MKTQKQKKVEVWMNTYKFIKNSLMDSSSFDSCKNDIKHD